MESIPLIRTAKKAPIPASCNPPDGADPVHPRAESACSRRPFAREKDAGRPRFYDEGDFREYYRLR